MLKEFKKFAVRGNVIDLAVAVIIGGAFGKIVSSFVNDIVMPIIGVILGGVNFTELTWVLVEATDEVEAVAVRYGLFIQNIIDFVIIAFVIFLMIRLISSMKKKEEEAPSAPPAPEPTVILLEEIRDLLKKS